MPSEQPGAEPKRARLHPVSPLFGVFSAASRLLVPGLLVLLLASRGSRYEVWAMVLFLPAVASAVLRYVSFRYTLDDSELVIREGIINRNERHIPYGRIQNIDLEQNPFHRMLNVAAVRIETAGGEEPEANMRVLSLQAVEEMRARVFRDRPVRPVAAPAAAAEAEPAAPPPTARPRTLLELSLRDVALYGVISNRGMAIVAAVVGLAWQVDLFERAPEWLQAWADPRRWMQSDLPGWLARVDPGWASPVVTTLTMAGWLLALLALLRVLSVAWSVLMLHGFVLTKQGDDLRTSYGLFTRRSATIPGHRIQLVTIRETLLHRWFRRVEVRVETAGGRQGADEGVSRQLLMPLLERRRLHELLRAIQPQLDLDAVEWRGLDPQAWRRIARRNVAGWLLAALAATRIVGVWAGITAALLLPLALWLARLRFNRMAYALTAHTTVYRSGWWVRYISAVRFGKMQVLRLSQSPFDRRWRMAGVQIDTAGARMGGHRVGIPYLPLGEARGVYDRLCGEAATTEFRW